MATVHQFFQDNAAHGRKMLAMLIDPDKTSRRQLGQALEVAEDGLADFYLVGGSLLTNGTFEDCISQLKEQTGKPVVIFPGGLLQVSHHADAILFLSLISGRNPEMLIGKHVQAAPNIRRMGLEAIPTGYMLVDGGNITSVQYMSNTIPIPADKDDIALCTAIAGEMLGMKLIYIDAGSGAKNPISSSMIAAVRGAVSVPIIVGGGIRTAHDAEQMLEAGADVLVVGNAAEEDPRNLIEIAAAVHSFQMVKQP